MYFCVCCRCGLQSDTDDVNKIAKYRTEQPSLQNSSGEKLLWSCQHFQGGIFVRSSCKLKHKSSVTLPNYYKREIGIEPEEIPPRASLKVRAVTLAQAKAPKQSHNTSSPDWIRKTNYIWFVVSNAKKYYLEQAWKWEQWFLLKARAPNNKNTCDPTIVSGMRLNHK